MIEGIVACDLDGTLLGNQEALDRLNQAFAPHRSRLALAYVTGRRIESALSLLTQHRLLSPDFVAAGVGTAVHRAPDFERDEAWHRHLLVSWDAAVVSDVAARFPQLEPQASEEQSATKHSYFLDAAWAADVLGNLAEALLRQGIKASLVYSSRRDLDIVPAAAGKGNAVRYLAKCLSLGLRQVLTCGDSGNDRDMLDLGCAAVVVANAQPELAGLGSRAVYRARTDYAQGVYEGLRFHGWLP